MHALEFLANDITGSVKNDFRSRWNKDEVGTVEFETFGEPLARVGDVMSHTSWLCNHVYLILIVILVCKSRGFSSVSK